MDLVDSSDSIASVGNGVLEFIETNFDILFKWVIKPFFAGLAGALGEYGVRKLVYIWLYWMPWRVSRNKDNIEEENEDSQKEDDF